MIILIITKKYDSEMSLSSRESPSLQEAIVSYIIIMYRYMTDSGYLNLMPATDTDAFLKHAQKRQAIGKNCLIQDGKV